MGRCHRFYPANERSALEVTTISRILLLIALGACGPINGAPQGPARHPRALREIARFDLPGPPGKRFDYLAIDHVDHWLLSAHLAANQTYVIDMKTNRVVGVIHDTPGVEGIVFVPETRTAYTSNWRDSTIGVASLSAMKVVKKLPTADKPDGSAYAAPFHRLYVSDERGKAEAIVDTDKNVIIKTLHFDSETGMPQYDPVARKVYVNLQDDNTFAVLDPATGTVLAKYPVAGCRGNHGMALDPRHHRAFLSCEGNLRMAVFDLDRHIAIASLPMPAGPDVIKFDPGLGRIYVACSSGFIAVFQQYAPPHQLDRYRLLDNIRVQPKVHSLAVDPETHRVYAPEEQENGQGVARMIVYEAVP
jgi:DNA-binding beta-propeller fold protein YncE